MKIEWYSQSLGVVSITDLIEMSRLTVKDNNNKCSIGSWITLGHPAIAEIMVKAGYEWLAVDLEHSAISIRDAEDLIRIIDLAGVIPLVRLTSNNHDQIKRVMDAGAGGVIVPMVNSPEQAQQAIEAVKYPPNGKRGIGLARAQGYGAKFQKYLEWQKENTIVIVQIEHIDAVNNIDAIFSVDGVDGFIIGPYDLSGSLGIPGQFDHPDYIAAVDKINVEAKKMNVMSGIHIIEPNPELLKQRIKEGYRFIAYSLDTRMLDVSCRTGIECIKQLRQ